LPSTDRGVTYKRPRHLVAGMHVLGIVGHSDAGKTTLVERLTAHLRERGRVATVKHLTHAPDVDTEGKDTARHRAAGAAATTGIVDDGDWFATGADRGLTETLDDYAETYDFALVEGFSDADLPQVVLGDREAAGEVLARAEAPEDVDVAAVVEALLAREPYETLGSLVADVKAAPEADRAGAIATFTGRVRAKDAPDDERTEFLEFETYDGVADQRLATIREELEARDGVLSVRLHHRTGVIPDGEDIVFVVVLAGHRREAFRAVEDGIDRLKDEVPIFKKEVTVGDEFWVHERE